jgi:plasmid stabilization system protein ParE
MRYRLSDLAEGDLREAWVYVATEASVGAADRLIDAIFERFELLASSPGWDEAGLSSARASGRSRSIGNRRRDGVVRFRCVCTNQEG